jgi:competence protein ComEC
LAGSDVLSVGWIGAPMTLADSTKSISRAWRPAYTPLILLLGAMAAGVALDRGLSLSVELWWFSAVLALGIWLSLWRRSRDLAASSVLLVGALAAAGAWHHAYWRLFPADEIGRSMDELFRPAVVEATAITSPRWVPAPPPTPLRTIPQGEQSQLLVWVTAIRDGRTFQPASGWATLQVEGQLGHIRAGDHLRVLAQGARPSPPLNPGEFDFSLHERARRVGCRLFAEFPQSVELLQRGSRSSLRRRLADVRSGGAELLRRYIAPERADLASAILLGTREQLDPHRNEGYLALVR